MMSEETLLDDDEQTKIVLCLSGGGFRATLFQLGAIRHLHSIGWLKYVSEIYSVSGGSILAGYLANHWASLLAEDSDFDQITERLRSFVQSNVRNRVIWKNWFFCWLIPFGWRKTDHLQAEYQRRLFKNGSSLNDLEAEFNKSKSNAEHSFPNFHVLSCDLKAAQLFSFGNSGFTIWTDNSQKMGQTSFEPKWIRNTSISLAKAVSASSAFPPLFEPVEITRHDHQHPSLPDFQLTDGGVFDNLGLALPASVFEQGGNSRILLLDAETLLTVEYSRDFRSVFPLARNLRANEIVMRNLSKRSYAEWADRFESSELRPETEGPGVGDEVQLNLGTKRTDLDTFSKAEVGALSQHGFDVTAKLIKKIKSDFQLPVMEVQAELMRTNIKIKQIENSRIRRFLRLLNFFNTLWAACVLIPLFLAISAGGYYSKHVLSKTIAEQQFKQLVSRRSKLETLVPGASIGLAVNVPEKPKLTDSVTLCCIVENRKGELFGVTAGHLGVEDYWGKRSSHVIHPGPIDGGMSKDRIGMLERTLYYDEPQHFDIGVFRLDSGVKWSNSIYEIGPLAGIGNQPILDEKVIIVGRSSGAIEQRVISVDTAIPLKGKLGSRVVRSCFVMQSPGKTDTESWRQFVTRGELDDWDANLVASHFDIMPAGDSGGVVINSKREVVGMIVGAGYGVAIAIPLKEPLGLKLLDMKLANE